MDLTRRQQHTYFMVSGIIAAVVREQFSDHIVLSDNTSLPLAEGLVVKRLGSGTRVTIAYSRDSGGGGEMVVQSVTRS
jgi:hypothetical protein